MNTIIKKFKRFLLSSVLLLFCLFYVFCYAAEENQFETMPHEIIKKIDNFSVKSKFSETSKYFNERLLSQKMRSYVDCFARDDLFFEDKINLKVFLENPVYNRMTNYIRKECNELYQRLMLDPLFFIKYCRVEKGTELKIPYFMRDKIEQTQDSILDDKVFLTILQSKKAKEKDKKLIVINTSLEDGEDDYENVFSNCLQEIAKKYPSFIRLVFLNSHFISPSMFFKIQNGRDYTDWFCDRIIQADSLSFEPNPYSRMRVLLQQEGNEDDDGDICSHCSVIDLSVLRAKNHQGNPLWFGYPNESLRMYPDLYVNERNLYGRTALSFHIEAFNRSAVFSGLDSIKYKKYYELFIDNIHALINNNIYLELQDGDGNNAVHKAIFSNDPMLLGILKQGSGFYVALNQQNKSGKTPLDFLPLLTKDRISEFFYTRQRNYKVIIKDKLEQ